tara:strand:- start:3199 stop:3375 length:177 start_codon:yes stop_codon:yes gene_type:complete
MNNKKSKKNIPPIPDGVREIQITFFNNKTNEINKIESLELFRNIKGGPFNSKKEDCNG